jgi:uncharacterized protein (TIGR03435 family)
MNLRLIRIALAFTTGVAGAAQSRTGNTARPEFEVASVKPDKIDPPGQSQYPACSGATFVALAPVRNIINWAYDIRQGYKTPDWAASSNERYSIEAKADGPVSLPECKAMVQHLLEDRFKLTIHRETKEMPVYFLVIGKNGPKLREVEPDSPGEGIRFQGQKVGGKGGLDMSLIASLLGQYAGRPVVDRTGYKGRFVFSLEFSRRPGDDRPDIFTAVKEQLGLRLEPGRAPVQFVVVDHLERPSEN